MKSDKIIIIEDELSIQLFVRELVEEILPHANIVACCQSVSESVNAIIKFKPDLVFLDVEIVEGKGFDVLQKTKDQNFEIIFITAHDNYAIKAIKANALDYILKPIIKSELREACQRFEQKKQNVSIEKKLLIEGRIASVKLKLSDIYWIEIKKGYCVFYTKDEHILSPFSISRYADQLDEQFLNIHRNCMINLTKAIKLNLAQGAEIILSNQKRLAISFRKKRLVIQKFKELNQ